VELKKYRVCPAEIVAPLPCPILKQISLLKMGKRLLISKKRDVVHPSLPHKN
jgi:hypothetical protein